MILLLLCCFGLASVGAAPGTWFGRSNAMILLPPGATRIDVVCGPLGPTGRVNRVLSPRIEIAGWVEASRPFALEVKAILVRRLVPLFVAVTAGTDGIDILSTLFFGPVQIDWGRSWGDTPSQWGSAQLSARSYLSMFVGVERSGSRFEPFLGVRMFPKRHGLWEIGLSVRSDGIRLSAGGAWW